MKKRVILLLTIGITVVSLCACGTQEDLADNNEEKTVQAGTPAETQISTASATAVRTEAPTPAPTASATAVRTEAPTPAATASATTAPTEAPVRSSDGVETVRGGVKESVLEFISLLDEINENVKPGTAGSSMIAVKTAAHLMNWGVGTTMTTDEIRTETAAWLSDKGNEERMDFSDQFASVYTMYQKLLKPGAEELLISAGCDDAAYPWSDSPLETVEAIADVVQLP